MEDTVLEKWYDCKNKIKILEERIDKYKKIVEKEMNSKQVDSLSIKGFTVKRRKTTRTSLCKDNVPEDVWKKYSSKSHFDAFFLTKGTK